MPPVPRRRRSPLSDGDATRCDANRESHWVGSRRPREGSNAEYNASSLPDAPMPIASRNHRSVPSYRPASFARIVAALFEWNAALRHRHFAQDGGRGVLRQAACLVEHGRLHLTQRTERGDADLRVGVGEQALDFADAGRTEMRQQPRRARAVIGVRIGEDALHGVQRPGSLRLEPLEAAAAHVDGRTEQRLNLTGRRAQIDRRRVSLRPFGVTR